MELNQANDPTLCRCCAYYPMWALHPLAVYMKKMRKTSYSGLFELTDY